MNNLEPAQYRIVKVTPERDIKLVLDLVEGRLTRDPERPFWRPPKEEDRVIQSYEPSTAYKPSETIYECRSCNHQFDNLPNSCPLCGCGIFNPRNKK